MYVGTLYIFRTYLIQQKEYLSHYRAQTPVLGLNGGQMQIFSDNALQTCQNYGYLYISMIAGTVYVINDMFHSAGRNIYLLSKTKSPVVGPKVVKIWEICPILVIIPRFSI